MGFGFDPRMPGKNATQFSTLGRQWGMVWAMGGGGILVSRWQNFWLACPSIYHERQHNLRPAPDMPGRHLAD